MGRTTRVGARLGALAALVYVAQMPGAASQAGEALATVNIPRAVMADGQSLAAGTYGLRVSTDAVTPVVGQSPDGARWVEFVRSGQSRGRELATVLAGDAVAAVVQGPRPASGAARVELLKGGEYLRVWINQGGTHYLIHLAVAPGH